MTRPDVEQISEGLRVLPDWVLDYHAAEAADRNRRFWDAVWMFILAALVTAGFALLFIGWAETGPGCPADPSWRGWCSDIPGVE